eukprot:TRINITY_DN67926_c0_g1_i1.p1 TRINITY_DN67926_c0_g1~~TRINITY_DN67926_c0_g1_i1.p1  ORF type:complete len:126 (+),score=23.90 TRINITY_DN67926_c0_g1_i1:147-524(+)
MLRCGALAITRVARASTPLVPKKSVELIGSVPAVARRSEIASPFAMTTPRIGEFASRPLVAEADTKVLLVGGALLCLAGSIVSAYVAVTYDPNKKEDRAILKRGEYAAGASVVCACALMYITMRR